MAELNRTAPRDCQRSFGEERLFAVAAAWQAVTDIDFDAHSSTVGIPRRKGRMRHVRRRDRSCSPSSTPWSVTAKSGIRRSPSINSVSNTVANVFAILLRG